MTDPTPLPPEAAKPSTSWTRIALAVSVALNLAVAGLAAGAWLKDGPYRGMPRELSFGPFSDALSPEDHHAMRAALKDRAAGFRAEREAARTELAALLTALRATPFDPAAVKASLSAISTRAADRLELGRSLIGERILAMSDAERQAFADRLERGLKRR
jgi:uncharacterized membrane protein